jgi:hypothetical protein
VEGLEGVGHARVAAARRLGYHLPTEACHQNGSNWSKWLQLVVKMTPRGRATRRLGYYLPTEGCHQHGSNCGRCIQMAPTIGFPPIHTPRGQPPASLCIAFSYTHSLFLSLSRTHSLSPFRSLSPSLSLSLSRTHTRSLSLSRTHSLSLARSHTLPYTLPLSHTHTLSLADSRTPAGGRGGNRGDERAEPLSSRTGYERCRAKRL